MVKTAAERAKKYRDGKKNVMKRDASVTGKSSRTVTKPENVTQCDESAIKTNAALVEPNSVLSNEPWDVEKWRRGGYSIGEIYAHLKPVEVSV